MLILLPISYEESNIDEALKNGKIPESSRVKSSPTPDLALLDLTHSRLGLLKNIRRLQASGNLDSGQIVFSNISGLRIACVGVPSSTDAELMQRLIESISVLHDEPEVVYPSEITSPVFENFSNQLIELGFIKKRSISNILNNATKGLNRD